MLVLQNNKKLWGMKKRRVSLALQVAQSSGQILRELPAARTARRSIQTKVVQIQESGSATLRKRLKEIQIMTHHGMKHSASLPHKNQSISVTAWSTFTKIWSVQHLPTIFLVKTAMEVAILQLCRNKSAFPESQSAWGTGPWWGSREEQISQQIQPLIHVNTIELKSTEDILQGSSLFIDKEAEV